MDDCFHDHIYEHPQSGLKYMAKYYYDTDYGAPERELDSHGAVRYMGFDVHDEMDKVDELHEAGIFTEDDAMRIPAYQLLHSNQNTYIYYDTVASSNHAITEWGCKPEDAADVVARDFEYLRGWYQDDWHWMYVTLTKLDEDGLPMNGVEHCTSLGGLESTLLEDEAQLSSTLEEMAHVLEGDLRRGLHKDQLELPLT